MGRKTDGLFGRLRELIGKRTSSTTTTTTRNNETVNVLGIETTCDDTGVAVVTNAAPCGDQRIKSNSLSSQHHLNSVYGGVVPHFAAREHERAIPCVLHEALLASLSSGTPKEPFSAKDVSIPFEDDTRIEEAMSQIDAIAIAIGPGEITLSLLSLSSW